MELRDKLILLRKGKELSQADLAEILNVSRQAISRWEVGTSVPSMDNLSALSRLYNVSVDSLMRPDNNAETIVKEQVNNEEKEEVTIFAVNRNLKEDVVLNTDVRSFEGYRVAEHIVLESDDLKVVNAFGQENVKPKTTEQTTMDNGELTSMLHKASWNVIRLVKDNK